MYDQIRLAFELLNHLRAIEQSTSLSQFGDLKPGGRELDADEKRAKAVAIQKICEAITEEPSDNSDRPVEYRAAVTTIPELLASIQQQNDARRKEYLQSKSQAKEISKPKKKK